MLRKVFFLIGGFAVVVASFLGTLWVMDNTWPRCPSGATLTFSRPFEKYGTLGYVWQAPSLANVANMPGAISRSKYIVCEDGYPLGPAHSDLGDVQKKGGGRYSHWTAGFIFSTSDNSDPSKNGRTYTAVLPNGQ